MINDLEDIAARALLAVLASVPPGTIDPRSYWDRAQASLKAAAQRGETWQEWVTLLSRQLQVVSLRKASAESLKILEHLLGPRYSDLRRICARTDVYIVAHARIIREEQKAGAS